MADYITMIRTASGDKQIDYNALANLPDLSLVGEVKILDSDENIISALPEISFTDAEAAAIRDNLKTVSYSAQTLTEPQQAQARQNIGAPSMAELGELSVFVTPQMYGAVADGSTDDADAIQAAINSGKTVFFPKGSYKITKSITINSTINLHAEDSTIEYSGTDYAIIVKKFDNGTLRFGKIISENGGCIKLDCTTNYVQYLNLYWAEMRSKTNCVYCYTPNVEGCQWINEIRFFNGRFMSGATGVHADAMGKQQLNGFRFVNVGIEGVDVGYYIANTVHDWIIIGTRQAECDVLFKTVGEVYDITYYGAAVTCDWMLDLSSNTNDFRIIGRIAETKDWTTVGHDMHVHNGIMHVKDQRIERYYKNLYNADTFDLNAQTGFARYRHFMYGGKDLTITLSPAYGCDYGINEICLVDGGGNSKTHTIKDHNGNTLVSAKKLNYGQMAVYQYVYGFGWVAVGI